jgi:hypothetical protein
MILIRLVVLCAVAAVALVAGCGGQTIATVSPSPVQGTTAVASESTTNPGTASAEAVLEQYYLQLSEGRVDDACTLVAPDVRSSVKALLKEDPFYIGLTDLHLTAVQHGMQVANGGPAAWRNYVDLCEIQADFVTKKASITGQPAGDHVRFGILGKLTSDGPWMLVAAPGTGP